MPDHHIRRAPTHGSLYPLSDSKNEPKATEATPFCHLHPKLTPHRFSLSLTSDLQNQPHCTLTPHQPLTELHPTSTHATLLPSRTQGGARSKPKASQVPTPITLRRTKTTQPRNNPSVGQHPRRTELELRTAVTPPLQQPINWRRPVATSIQNPKHPSPSFAQDHHAGTLARRDPFHLQLSSPEHSKSHLNLAESHRTSRARSRLLAGTAES